jgi:hypothetical protein
MAAEPDCFTITTDAPVSRAVGLESLLCALALVAWLTAPAVVWIVWRAAVR